MNVVRIAGWVATTAVAAVVGLSSHVIANQSKNPVASIAAGFGPEGGAKANLAVTTYAARVAKDPKAAVKPLESAMARETYRSEPLSSAAVGIMAAAMRKPADRQVREELLNLAGRLSRRNSLVAAQILEASALRGDNRTFFAWLSRSVLTDDERRTLYVGAMADATAREGSVEALTPVIGPSPRWDETYWEMVVRRPASLVNAAKVRIAVAGKPWRQTEIKSTDRKLAVNLADNGEFEMARELGLALGQGRGTRDANLIVNGNFASQPELPPLDWNLTALGNLGASIETRDKSLVISAIGGARGTAARQLIRLPAGRYTLGWVQSSSAPIKPDALFARIRCADPKSDPLAAVTVPLVTGKRSAAVEMPSDGCMWRWLSVEVAVPDDAAGVDAYLRNLSLTPAAGTAAEVPPHRP